MLEAAVEDVLATEVRKLGGMTFKVVPVVAGLPDRMVVWPWGVIELVELKKVGGDVRASQKVMHRKLAKRGITVPVLTGSAEVRAWVAERAASRVASNGSDSRRLPQ